MSNPHNQESANAEQSALEEDRTGNQGTWIWQFKKGTTCLAGDSDSLRQPCELLVQDTRYCSQESESPEDF